jgi:hypothetical protein
MRDEKRSERCLIQAGLTRRTILLSGTALVAATLTSDALVQAEKKISSRTCAMGDETK